MMEEWRPVVGFEGKYEVSNTGWVRSMINNPKIKRSDKILCVTVCNNRRRVHLTKKGVRVKPLIYKIVGEAFIPNPNNYKLINHLDGNSLNDRVDNLEWCTPSMNNKHAYKLGRTNPMTGKKGALHHGSKPIIAIKDGLEIEFPSRSDAHRELKISSGNILRVIKGKRKTAGGYFFKYKNE